MSKYIIRGNKKLRGKIEISGSKNASLAILATALLNKNEVTFYNVPQIEDVKTMIFILKKIGCKVIIDCDKITISSKDVRSYEIPKELMNKARSTVILAGALIGRFNKAVFYYPGGCNIGKRPIDIHLEGFEKIGINVKNIEDKIICETNKLKSNKIYLKFPSVGATENLILASVFIKGTTCIYNAAKEPEIKDLVNCLNKMGARIYGAGTNKITIVGVKELKKTSYRIMPDRIEAGTYLGVVTATKGNIELTNINPTDLVNVLYEFKKMGCKVYFNNNTIKLYAPKRIKSVDINTQVFPGIPTDMQPIFTSILCVSNGTSIIQENIFEKRFEYCDELVKMGAKIKRIDDKKILVKGVNQLEGKKVNAKDLRGGASLIIAGLMANNETTIENAFNILRGYEKIDKKLKSIGANIKFVK